MSGGRCGGIILNMDMHLWTQEFRSRLANKIRLRREELGFTQSELQNRSFLRQPTIVELENASTRVTSEILFSVAGALKVSPAFLLREENVPV